MNIGIVGLGLIGGSLALAIKKYTNNNVFGNDNSNDVVVLAKKMGAIDCILDDTTACLCDIVIFAVYPQNAEKTIKEYIPKLKNGAVVTDIIGVKRKLVRELERLSKEFTNIEFISTHPMAGKEVGGIQNATCDLFKNSFVITVNINASEKTEKIFTELFAQIGVLAVQKTNAENHDRMIAYTSQLAHIVSCSYIKNPLSENHAGYSAGSFLDMTRVASINAELWSNLCLSNNDLLAEQISRLVDNLNEFKNALICEDKNELIKLFNESSKAKAVSEKNYKERLKNES